MDSIKEISSSSTIIVTLGKRKRRDSLVIHLSSPAPSTDNDPTYTESEHEHEPRHGSELQATAPRSRSPKSKRYYACTFEGCTKTYMKPSRLTEHERSHTGDRPFICSVCNKSYLRETHLQAHARTHLPSSAKPFVCAEQECGKRFWTSQHLNIHAELHRGEKPFKCTEECCDAAFSKHHQLQGHICTVHSPPDTKPYRCEHPGCTKSFATNQKLTAHSKTHDDKRYTCVHRSCLPPEGTDPTYHPTWSALQHHMRTVHQPTCPYPSCNGKTFSQQKGLRAHLKIHAQRDQEDNIKDTPGSGSENEVERPHKRRRGGEIGRDWVCEVDGCDKDFKSKKALTTHHNIAHLGRRDFVCLHEHCKRAFGYKHLLQRHLAKLHAPQSASSDQDADETEPEADTRVDIDFLTGKAYISHAKESIKQMSKLQCPFPHLPPQLSGEIEQVASSSKQTNTCQYVFSRAYDLRRHLHAEHGVDVEREKVDDWVRDEKGTIAVMGPALVS
ncbi:hypothetical protein LXA43DRAFT_877089 [Ganoderma leucocontextum]|nr:hypothetical protein LXA43DRAFT_877089 [Ganoderma leucocontextum]